MTRVGAQSLAAALSAFIAVTPFAGRHNTSPPPRAKSAATWALRTAGVRERLAGVGMPDTSPGNIPLKPLTVIVKVTAETGATFAEIARLGDWLTTHHGRARLALMTTHSATRLLEPSMIDRSTPTRSIRSPSTFIRATFRHRRGQRLLITIGQGTSATLPGVTSLRLPIQRDAPVVDVVALHDRGGLRQPVDARRDGVIAATAARAVISLAHLREAPSVGRR